MIFESSLLFNSLNMNVQNALLDKVEAKYEEFTARLKEAKADAQLEA